VPAELRAWLRAVFRETERGLTAHERAALRETEREREREFLPKPTTNLIKKQSEGFFPFHVKDKRI